MLRKVLLIAALILGIAAMPAAAQYQDSLVITPGQGRPGDSISFHGSGCAPGEEVVISIRHRNGTTYEVARVIADAQGNFSGTFLIPDVPNGRYDVISSCGTVLAGALEVLGDTPPGGPGGPGGPSDPGTGGTGAQQGGGRSGPLPATGSDFNTLGLIGLALLAAGGLVILTTRNRGTRAA